MSGPLDGDMADASADALGDVFLDAVLTHYTAVDGSNAWTPGAPQQTTFDCKAMHDLWSNSLVAGGLVDAADRKIMILAGTLSTTPKPGDKITIRDETFTIVPAGAGQPSVATDPAQAVWTVRARK